MIIDAIAPLPSPSGSASPAIVLALNGGSSTIRFAAFGVGDPLAVLFRGTVKRVGMNGATLSVTAPGAARNEFPLEHVRAASTGRYLLNWLETQLAFADVRAIGHRIVHGMSRSEHQVLTPALLADLKHSIDLDSEHLPRELDLIAALEERYPELAQVACFDTAFHRAMPRIAKVLPIPRPYQARGIERYGFHGLSYTYLMEELGRRGDPAATRGRVILAHLGNGASMAAVRDGSSIDTSMSFTPTGGLMMGTRSGDLDPGLGNFLAHTQQLSGDEFQRMVNHESGLLGVSQVSSDMLELLALEATDARVAEAIELFCYQAKKWLGCFAAALGGLDTLVFAGGIGENAPSIRARICDGLGFLGVELDAARNAANAGVVSADDSRVTVRVIETDEELMIARSTIRVLGLESNTRVVQ